MYVRTYACAESISRSSLTLRNYPRSERRIVLPRETRSRRDFRARRQDDPANFSARRVPSPRRTLTRPSSTRPRFASWSIGGEDGRRARAGVIRFIRWENTVWGNAFERKLMSPPGNRKASRNHDECLRSLLRLLPSQGLYIYIY